MNAACTDSVREIGPGEFEAAQHYYPRVLNAQIHSAISYFLSLGNDRLITRYCHMNPEVAPEFLGDLLSYRPCHLAWSGSDIFHVTTAGGRRQMVLLETNSCPAGQRAMPLFHDADEHGGYRALIENVFLPITRGRELCSGELAVLYDDNLMEASGYAATLADCTGETVYLAPFVDGERDPAVRFVDGVMQVRTADGIWHPVRAAFRCVRQRPWNRIPVDTRTMIFNPILACLAGGRNKLVAAKAYNLFNAELSGSGLQIRTPETIWDVSLREVPMWVKKFGGFAVVKTPYSNFGQGVFTITCQQELDRFMERDHPYEKFIVQSLIGNYHWSSKILTDRLYHVGTIPGKRGRIYVADLRMMIGAGDGGYRPLVVFARRARMPLVARPDPDTPSWDMLGTNLTSQAADGGWETDTQRLLLMDRRDFNVLGLGIDDLVDAFIQSVLAAIAIDKFASILTNPKGRFRRRLFRSINNDAALMSEILE